MGSGRARRGPRAAGGTAGIAHPAERITDWYALGAVSGFWALAGSAAVGMIARARPARLPRRLPRVFGWVGSGSLFAWSGRKLPITLYMAWADPVGARPPEDLAVAVELTGARCRRARRCCGHAGARVSAPPSRTPETMPPRGPGRDACGRAGPFPRRVRKPRRTRAGDHGLSVPLTGPGRR